MKVIYMQTFNTVINITMVEIVTFSEEKEHTRSCAVKAPFLHKMCINNTCIIKQSLRFPGSHEFF